MAEGSFGIQLRFLCPSPSVLSPSLLTSLNPTLPLSFPPSLPSFLFSFSLSLRMARRMRTWKVVEEEGPNFVQELSSDVSAYSPMTSLPSPPPLLLLLYIFSSFYTLHCLPPFPSSLFLLPSPLFSRFAGLCEKHCFADPLSLPLTSPCSRVDVLQLLTILEWPSGRLIRSVPTPAPPLGKLRKARRVSLEEIPSLLFKSLRAAFCSQRKPGRKCSVCLREGAKRERRGSYPLREE